MEDESKTDLIEILFNSILKENNHQNLEEISKILCARIQLELFLVLSVKIENEHSYLVSCYRFL